MTFYITHEKNHSEETLISLTGNDFNILNPIGATGLMHVACQGNVPLVEIFLGHGADPLKKDIYGNNALDLVCRALQDIDLSVAKRDCYLQIKSMFDTYLQKNVNSYSVQEFLQNSTAILALAGLSYTTKRY